MRTEFLDEVGDTLFATVMAAAIGLSAANLAIQVNKERAEFDAAALSRKVGQVVNPPPSPAAAVIRNEEAAGQLNY